MKQRYCRMEWGGWDASLGYDLCFHSGSWTRMCMFWFCATSKPFVCFMFPNAQPDPVVSGGNRGPCVACGIVSRVGVTERLVEF